MNELAALGWVYVACALWLGSDRPRGVARWPLLQPIRRARAAQAAAALLLVAATLHWNASEPGPAAFIAIPVAVMACGTLVSLIAAASPRAVLAGAVAALPIGLILAALGAANG